MKAYEKKSGRQRRRRGGWRNRNWRGAESVNSGGKQREICENSGAEKRKEEKIENQRKAAQLA